MICISCDREIENHEPYTLVLVDNGVGRVHEECPSDLQYAGAGLVFSRDEKDHTIYVCRHCRKQLASTENIVGFQNVQEHLDNCKEAKKKCQELKENL